MRVLVLDDDGHLVVTLRRGLTLQGHEVLALGRRDAFLLLRALPVPPASPGSSDAAAASGETEPRVSSTSARDRAGSTPLLPDCDLVLVDAADREREALELIRLLILHRPLWRPVVALGGLRPLPKLQALSGRDVVLVRRPFDLPRLEQALRQALATRTPAR